MKELNIEPKFKIGDIITNGKIIGKVDENENNKYHGWFGYDKDLSVHYADIPDVENWHKWTIQDAKDGDVLSYRNGQWIFILKRIIDKDSFEYYTLWSTTHNDLTINDSAFSLLINSIYPATKKQRDILFQKIHEAGYEWDSEKKELKEIEQKPADIDLRSVVDKEANAIWKEINTGGSHSIIDSFNQFYGICMQIAEAVVGCKNPAWTEEDEKILNLIIARLHSHSNVDAEEYGKDYYWFKSLKDRMQH